MDGATFPPAPWRLRGRGLVAMRWIPLRTAQRLVPADVRVVPLLPRRSLALVICARYGRGSTLQYSELIIAPGLVRAKGRLGWWISALWVDDAAALAGGRSIWGLPKQLARFEWRRRSADAWHGVRVREAAGNELVCELAISRNRRREGGLPLPLAGPVLCRREGQLMRFTMRGQARVRLLRGSLRSPRLDADDAGTTVTLAALTRFRMRVPGPH